MEETRTIDSLLEKVKEWGNSGKGNRTYMAVTVDKNSDEVRVMFKGDPVMIGNIILKVMEQEPEVAQTIYTAAVVYAANHFTPEYIELVNNTYAAFANDMRPKNIAFKQKK
jgi:hypothetical protein